MKREQFEKYAASWGMNPESVAFPAIVDKIMDMHKYVQDRRETKGDSMYDPHAKTVRETVEKM